MKKLLYSCLLLLFAACGKEDKLSPSYTDRDWVKIIDNPNDPIDHQRYLIYEKYNVSIYFNDTIGSEERVDAHGNKYTYYEMLKPFYIPMGSTRGDTIRRYLTKTEIAGQQKLLETIGTQFLEEMPKLFNIRNVLIVDKIDKNGKELSYFVGYNTIVISKALTFNDSFWKNKRIEICSDKALADIAWVRDNFNAISEKLNSTSQNTLKSYSKEEYYYNLEYYLNNPAWGWDFIWLYILTTPERINGSKTMADVGFLSINPIDTDVNKDPATPEKDRITPIAGTDLKDYQNLLFSYSRAEVLEKYKNYPVVLQKYQVLVDRFASYGIIIE